MMAGLLETIEAIKGAKELATSITAISDADPPERELRSIKRLIVSLRQIYFSPRGVIYLLEMIRDGEYPNREQIESILPEFNDYESRVGRIRLEMDSPRDNGLQLTLRAERQLREISYGKGGVREKVKATLNEALTFDAPVEPDQARELLDEISRLNIEIENAEQALVEILR